MKSEITKLREDLYQSNYSDSRPKSLPVYSEVLPRERETVKNNENSEEFNLDESSLEDVERYKINRALEKLNGSKRKAAKSLGISERTLYRKIKEYELPF